MWWHRQINHNANTRRVLTILVTSDLHLEDTPATEYRWGIFPWMKEQIKKYSINAVLLLGDTSDKKDRHPSSFVNKLIDNIHELGQLTRVIILRGNHDYISESEPFLRFVNRLSGTISFIVTPIDTEIDGHACLLLPNSRSPLTDWSELIPSFVAYDYIFMHQTLTGAVAENGTKLTGIDRDIFKRIEGEGNIIISGDVHVPQRLGDNFIYVGSPYRVHFGDRFSPRCLLIGESSIEDITYPTISRHTIVLSSPDELDKMPIKENDQIKVRFVLGDALEWDRTKREILAICHSKKLVLHQLEFIKEETSLAKDVLARHDAKMKSMSPTEVLEQFCSTTSVKDTTKQYGIDILHELGHYDRTKSVSS